MTPWYQICSIIFFLGGGDYIFGKTPCSYIQSTSTSNKLGVTESLVYSFLLRQAFCFNSFWIHKEFISTEKTTDVHILCYCIYTCKSIIKKKQKSKCFVPFQKQHPASLQRDKILTNFFKELWKPVLFFIKLSN